MDWTAIGSWAGNTGPFLAIIAVQTRIILKLLDRFFAQQSILTDALKNSRRAIDHAENDPPPDV